MRVAFVQWSNNPLPHSLLFNADPSQACAYYSIPHLALREELQRHGVELLPYEAFSSSDKADALICVDCPPRRFQLDDLRINILSPSAPLILVAMESAQARPELLSLKELLRWDHVFHYSHLLPKSKCITRYFLPSNLPFLHLVGPDYRHDRKRLVGMMATNKPSRWSNVRASIPIKFLNGYRFSFLDCYRWLHLEDGLPLRRFWVDELARLIPDEFRVFGGQWSGEPYSPIHRFIKPKSNPCAMGHQAANTLSIIKGFKFFFATENLIGDPGYISEKVFSVIRAGSVPIYKSSGGSCRLRLAAREVGEFFVDLCRYPKPSQLLGYLAGVSSKEYGEMLSAGKRFLLSQMASDHSPGVYSRELANRMARLLGR